jgi:uncharacterized protein (UPF0548 family)
MTAKRTGDAKRRQQMDELKSVSNRKDARIAVLALRKPSAEKIANFLAAQAMLDLTYSAVGATATTQPPGYVVDHTRIALGKGQDIFLAARAALECWEQFHLTWVEAVPATTPIKEGAVVAVLAHSLGLWWLNACRIVYVVAEENRFGFAYGTLPDHMASGEERFLIEWDRNDGNVWYDILPFSRPHGLLARLGYPWMRRVQKRFAQESAAALRKAVGCASGIEEKKA